MKPSHLDRAAEVVLNGILAQLPKLSPERLDALLARVSLLHRRRIQKANEEQIARGVQDLIDRMYSAAPESVTASEPQPRSKYANSHRPKTNDAGEFVCIICGEQLEWKGTGRKPVFCLRHKNPSARTRAMNGASPHTREGTP